MECFLYFLSQNFDPSATVNDGSCTLPAGLSEGCTCKEAVNFDASADLFDGSCVFPEKGVIGEDVPKLRQLLEEMDKLIQQQRKENEELQISNLKMAEEIGNLKVNCSHKCGTNQTMTPLPGSATRSKYQRMVLPVQYPRRSVKSFKKKK